jgi:hypothetical protein
VGPVDKFRGHKDGKPSSRGIRKGNITTDGYFEKKSGAK